MTTTAYVSTNHRRRESLPPTWARLIIPLCLALVGVLSGCTERTGASTAAADAARPEMARIDTAAGLRNIACFDVTVADSAVHLLLGKTTEAEDEGLAFYYTRSEDAGESWTSPVRIPTDHAPPGDRLHRGRDPQIAVRGDRIMALWTSKGDGPWGSGPLGVALSEDGGKTWRPGPVPSVSPGDADKGAGYRFPAVAAGRHAFHVVWIHAVGGVVGMKHMPGMKGMKMIRREDVPYDRSLRYARLAFGADHWTTTTIDPASCACCWNALAISPGGTLIALYRNREPRDMAAVVSRDGGESWSESVTVGDFNWYINACPHVGGGLALTSGAWWATVWTGHPEHAGAYALRSTDGGRSWSIVDKLGTRGHSGWHTDVAALSPRRAAAVWDQSLKDGGQAVFIAFTADGGKTWSEARRLSTHGRRAGYPRIVAVDGGYLALWSEYDEKHPTPRLRMRVVERLSGRAATLSAPLVHCAVCGGGHEFAATAQTPTMQFEGKTYYSCSQYCEMAFDKEPRRYVSRN